MLLFRDLTKFGSRALVETHVRRQGFDYRHKRQTFLRLVGRVAARATADEGLLTG